jgi:hypothetical protein
LRLREEPTEGGGAPFVSRASNGGAGRRVLCGDGVIITNRSKNENPDFSEKSDFLKFLTSSGNAGRQTAQIRREMTIRRFALQRETGKNAENGRTAGRS